MSGTITTLVTPEGTLLTDTLIDTTARKIRELGGEGVTVDVLDIGRAVDVITPVSNSGFIDQLRLSLANLGALDVFVQPENTERRKKLLVSDMDATMIEGEILDDLAAHFGLHDKIAPITARAMKGELDFKESMKLRIALLKGMPMSVLLELTENVKTSKGAATLLKTLKRHGCRCVLVSGGFDVVANAVVSRLGFDRQVANSLPLDHAFNFTGDVSLPIVDKDTKKNVLLEECGRLGIAPALSAAVGDGANDIPMLQAAGIGIGYFGKPLVQAATPYQIRYTDLTSILYMQGYRREEISV